MSPLEFFFSTKIKIKTTTQDSVCVCNFSKGLCYEVGSACSTVNITGPSLDYSFMSEKHIGKNQGKKLIYVTIFSTNERERMQKEIERNIKSIFQT